MGTVRVPRPLEYIFPPDRIPERYHRLVYEQRREERRARLWKAATNPGMIHVVPTFFRGVYHLTWETVGGAWMELQ